MTAPDQHRYNRRLFLNDNLPVMKNLDDEIADAIITDPPFNSNRFYEHNFGSKTTDKKGKKRPGFKDIWTMDRERAEEHQLLRKAHHDLYQLCEFAQTAHSVSMKAYLTFMSVRIVECHRLLKETGSMFLHCDPTANGYLRMLMDCVFGKENFLNEIIWSYSSGGIGKRWFARKHDTILFYARNAAKHKFNLPRQPTKDASRFNKTDEAGRKYYDKGGGGDTIWMTELRSPLFGTFRR